MLASTMGLVWALAVPAAAEQAAHARSQGPALVPTSQSSATLSVATAESQADPLADPLFDELDDEFADIPSGFPDPHESLNRRVLGFNRVIARFLLDPVTDLYRLVVPKPVKHAIVRVVANIDSVPILVNDLLQLQPKRAGVTLVRFGINSTVGLVGIFDPARHLGLESHHADFGQTLAYAGVRSGAYLIIPVIGPSTTRDVVGTITDSVLNPVTFWLGFNSIQTLTYGGTAGVSVRELHIEALRALESSLDYYAALRNGYYQTRQAQLWSERPEPPWRQRVCRSMLARLRRQRWRIPPSCRATTYLDPRAEKSAT